MLFFVLKSFSGSIKKEIFVIFCSVTKLRVACALNSDTPIILFISFSNFIFSNSKSASSDCFLKNLSEVDFSSVLVSFSVWSFLASSFFGLVRKRKIFI